MHTREFTLENDADAQEKQRLFDCVDSQVSQGAALLYGNAPVQEITNLSIR
jgi:hypothetical protein